MLGGLGLPGESPQGWEKGTAQITQKGGLWARLLWDPRERDHIEETNKGQKGGSGKNLDAGVCLQTWKGGFIWVGGRGGEGQTSEVVDARDYSRSWQGCLRLQTF